MATARRRVTVASLNGPGRNGHDKEEAVRALKELKTIGGLLVRSSVSLLNGTAADEFVWLGRQIQSHADVGMAALGGDRAPRGKPRRRP